MNVTPAPTPIPATTEPTVAAASPAPGTAGAPSATAGGVFGALLALATAADPEGEVTIVPAAGDRAADTEPVPESVDWALPFLAPAPAPAPTPLDFELPDGEAPGTTATLREAAAALTAAAPEPFPAGAEPAAAPGRPESASAPQGAVRTVATPVGDPRWPTQVGHELRVLVDRGVQSATLRVSPEHLGPIDVRIEIVQDKATVVFGAAQAETRAALQEAIPRLREMFAAGGLALADAGVREDRSPAPPPRHGRWGAAGSDADEAAAPTPVRLQVGLVDAYA